MTGPALSTVGMALSSQGGIGTTTWAGSLTLIGGGVVVLLYVVAAGSERPRARPTRRPTPSPDPGPSPIPMNPSLGRTECGTGRLTALLIA